MTIRPPIDPAGGEPSAEELLALDAFLDALAATPAPAPVPAHRGAVDAGLAAVARRLGDLPEVIWDAAAPLYQPFGDLATGDLVTGDLVTGDLVTGDLVTGDPPPVGLAPVVELVSASRPVRRHGGRPRWSPHGRRSAVVGWVATAAAVVVVLAVVGFHVFSGQPSRPVTGVSTVPTWRLAGFIDQETWQQAPSSGAVGSSVAVTCPVVGTCYADDPGGSQVAVVEATTDGGATWHASALPAGVRLTSSPACPAVGNCLVAGLPGGTTGPTTGPTAGAVVVATTDGGATWTTYPVPGASQLVSLACPAATDCLGAGYGPPTAADPTGGAVVARSTDGGRTWSVTPLAATFVPSSSGGLACAGRQCVVGGTDDITATSAATARAAAWYSADGGATWSPSAVPSGLTALRAVSCTGDRCVGVANGPAPAGASASFPYGTSQAVATTDGGRNWTTTGSEGLAPAYLDTVSCTTASTCWAGGYRSGHGPGSQVGVIARTDDGGVTWTDEPLPTTQTASSRSGGQSATLDVQDVSSLSCPADGRCLAMAAQGLTAEPAQQHLALTTAD
ncbi:MAG TPA: sialidase family protein [Acidimicrobiales bacterium]|nr:sialidase family protein [Acidimicrobiales bacterium]